MFSLLNEKASNMFKSSWWGTMSIFDAGERLFVFVMVVGEADF
jgi:hypothetical protein